MFEYILFIGCSISISSAKLWDKILCSDTWRFSFTGSITGQRSIIPPILSPKSLNRPLANTRHRITGQNKLPIWNMFFDKFR